MLNSPKLLTAAIFLLAQAVHAQEFDPILQVLFRELRVLSTEERVSEVMTEVSLHSAVRRRGIITDDLESYRAKIRDSAAYRRRVLEGTRQKAPELLVGISLGEQVRSTTGDLELSPLVRSARENQASAFLIRTRNGTLPGYIQSPFAMQSSTTEAFTMGRDLRQFFETGTNDALYMLSDRSAGTQTPLFSPELGRERFRAKLIRNAKDLGTACSAQLKSCSVSISAEGFEMKKKISREGLPEAELKYTVKWDQVVAYTTAAAATLSAEFRQRFDDELQKIRVGFGTVPKG